MLQKCTLFHINNTDKEGGEKKRAFDEGWSRFELLSTSHGWVDDNSWADDFLPLSIIFNGVRDRLLTETNPDGFWKKQHGADSDGYMRRYHSGDNESYLTQHRGDGTPAACVAFSTTPIVQTRLSIMSHFFFFFPHRNFTWNDKCRGGLTLSTSTPQKSLHRDNKTLLFCVSLEH